MKPFLAAAACRDCSTSQLLGGLPEDAPGLQAHRVSVSSHQPCCEHPRFLPQLAHHLPQDPRSNQASQCIARSQSDTCPTAHKMTWTQPESVGPE